MCRLAVSVDEAPPAVHEVNQVVGGVDSGENGAQGRRVLDVAPDDLDAIGPLPAGDASRVADHDTNVVAAIEKAGNESPADIAGCAGDKDLHLQPPPGVYRAIYSLTGTLRAVLALVMYLTLPKTGLSGPHGRSWRPRTQKIPLTELGSRPSRA